jgi:serine/arginine repetitive matrix protein 2
MFLDTLERIRPKNTSQDTTDEGETARNSIKSSSSSSVSSSPSSRSTKRYSNNLFGSGRLKDYTYLKTVTSRGSTTSSAHTTSLTQTEASEKTVSLSSFRPVTPDASSNPSSVQSSPNEKGPIRSTPVVPSSPSAEQQVQAITAAEYRLHKSLGPSVLKRASMALDEAIREIEDEVEDEILLPRSAPAPRGSLDQPTAEVVRPYFYFLTVNKKTLNFDGCRDTARHLYLRVGWPSPLIKLFMTNSVNAEHPLYQHARYQATFRECPDP